MYYVLYVLYYVDISARKCKKAVFVSYNLPQDSELLPLVENRLFEEITAHPDRF